MWNAPATCKARTRAPSGGSFASAASCSIVPPATICPAPLLLAGVSPCSASLAKTTSASPPCTADIPVGVCAAAAAIALPRSRTNTMACSPEMMFEAAAAVISPTLCPAPTPTTRYASAGWGNSSSRDTKPAATIKGCAMAVSLMVSASAVVPSSARSRPLTAESQCRRSAKVGISSQGAKKPGVCEPCPGAMTASTVLALRGVCPKPGATRTNNAHDF